MSNLTLRIISPKGLEKEIECDSVHLIMSDDSKGNGGGSIGIRAGFENAIIALGCGNIEAFDNSNRVFLKEADGGFATVKDNKITVILNGIDS